MATSVLDHRMQYPESPLDLDDTPYPCKGCGEILEEGKAFELAGNRWHIDCFRCNTCNTLLDSDANLLLLGDGSLICNNCTYSCSSCLNKIEDLAILTGDQAFCANCFKCRNCKRKIENLRYARTSQGIFCMDCHEALMARRRKKTSKGSSSKKSANIDKSLPAIPPPHARHTQYVPTGEEPQVQEPMPTLHEAPAPSVSKTMSELRTDTTDSDSSRPPTSQQSQPQGSLTLPSTTYRDNRRSFISGGQSLSLGGEEFLIPLAFDPNPPKSATPLSQQNTPQTRPHEEKTRDYFARDEQHKKSGSVSQSTSPQPLQRAGGHLRKPSDATPSRTVSTSSTLVQSEQPQSPGRSQISRDDSSRTENFRLQEAPKNRKVSSGRTTPRGDTGSSLSQQRSPELKETEIFIDNGRTTPRLSYEMSPAFTDGFNSPPQIPMSQSIPVRGDSLMTSGTKPIPRKEIIPSSLSQPLNDMSNATPARPPATSLDSAKTQGGKVISAPISSPGSQSIYDTPELSQGETTDILHEKFVQPRAPPQPPMGHSRNESISTLQSDNQKSPKLPQYNTGADFTLEEDISRILGLDEPTANESFLRRVSNSVRHGRSYSDRSGRFSRDRWPRSPVTGGGPPGHPEISSPMTSSPENREELAWFKNELRRERLKAAERDKKIAELESQINAAANISQVNVELNEKRSTMVVLDTQKEIVVRELEVLTEHIANAKTGNEPLDMSKLNSAVLRDLAEALDKLKKSFTPQIESLIQQRNELLEEITNLNQAKDKSFHEFEQLSSKNAQLAEFNNQLVDQIQNIYKTNRGPGMEELAKPNGLGIYSHSKDNSKVSIDSRDLQKPTIIAPPSINDPGVTYEAGEAGAIQSVAGAQVVEMKKGAVAKRFDWRKGQKMAKGLTKGVKGAFASAQQNYGRDMQFAETGAYQEQMRAGQEYSTIPRNDNEPIRQPGGWFANSTKPPGSKNGLYASSNNASTPSLLANAQSNLALFGTELEVRAEYEKTTIPGIVKRCIAEVEARGMDVEGIYRKSGGNSQVTQVKDGFEREPGSFDISDPDLDIHAITSGLKQYFRKLPTPLITYDVYDTLIELTKIPEGPQQREQRIEGVKSALADLPRVNYEVLEYLMAHLARVVVLEKENLMTPMNVAVVFAPTIMRPESVARELSDTKGKNEVVMWMVQEGERVFGSPQGVSRGGSITGGSANGNGNGHGNGNGNGSVPSANASVTVTGPGA